MPESDSLAILKHVLRIASLEIQCDFRQRISQNVQAVPPREEYSAAIALWLRLSSEERATLLVWMDEELFAPDISDRPSLHAPHLQWKGDGSAIWPVPRDTLSR